LANMKSYQYPYRSDINSEMCIGIGISRIDEIYRYYICLIKVYTYYWYQYRFDMNFKTDSSIGIVLI
jgi:hypothetical protein